MLLGKNERTTKRGYVAPSPQLSAPSSIQSQGGTQAATPSTKVQDRATDSSGVWPGNTHERQARDCWGVVVTFISCLGNAPLRGTRCASSRVLLATSHGTHRLLAHLPWPILSEQQPKALDSLLAAASARDATRCPPRLEMIEPITRPPEDPTVTSWRGPSRSWTL